MMELKQPPPTLPGFEPVNNVTEMPPQPRQRRTKPAEPPAPQPDDVTSALLDALGTVHQRVTARIAWHEAQLRQLREALKPFASIPTSEAGMSETDLVQELLAIAKKLPAGNDTIPGD
jgi:hypothetical protein